MSNTMLAQLVYMYGYGRFARMGIEHYMSIKNLDALQKIWEGRRKRNRRR